MKHSILLYKNIINELSITLKNIINEGVESSVNLNDVLKVLTPFGWKYSDTKSGFKIQKGPYLVTFHKKHDKSSNNKVDVGGLDLIREKIIEEFYQTGDLSTINAIDWKAWRLPNPLKRELKEYDPVTGKKIEKEKQLNKGQKLNQLRQEKAIKDANETYKDAALFKIYPDDNDSLYIMAVSGVGNRLKYNICRNENDRRPLQKQWTYDIKKENSDYYFGKDDMRMLKTKYYKILSDGSLEKKYAFIGESVNLKKYKKLLCN